MHYANPRLTSAQKHYNLLATNYQTYPQQKPSNKAVRKSFHKQFVNNFIF